MQSEKSGNLVLLTRLGDEVFKSFDRRALRSAYQQARFGDRLYGYQDVVLESCASCFRFHLGEVYYFDGRVWCELPDIVLEGALSRALVRAGVPKSDVINGRGKLLHSARGGASLSPLRTSPSIVGFSNGVWDFTDIDNPVGHKFSERLPILGVLPYCYDPSASCPLWVSFLSSVLPSGEVLKLQKYLGLGCVDRRLLTHKIEETLWLVGGGANGKSVVFDIVRAVYGADNISYTGLDTLLSGSSEVRARFVGSIVGKLFNYCSEVQSDDITRYADTFKSLCSGEPQTVRRLGRNPETAYDIPFLVFNMNSRPANRKMDRALLRRLLFVPFRTTVSAKDMDRELTVKLLGELPGIRNWMIEGYRALVRDGYQFASSRSTDAELEDYMLENGQTVQVFLNRRGYSCNRRTGHWEDKEQWVLSSALYEDYVSFCDRMLQEPLNQRAFGGEMSRLGWHDSGGGRKRTGHGYAYGIFCEKPIAYAMRV